MASRCIGIDGEHQHVGDFSRSDYACGRGVFVGFYDTPLS